jgi:DNA repair ATPase RecN
LHDAINKYSNEIILLKGTIDTGKTNYHSDFANALDDKDNAIARLRKELTNKDTKLREV